MRIKEKYIKEAIPALKKEFEIKNEMAIPKITKVVVNMGTQDYLKDKGVKEKLMTEFATIVGQAPQIRPAKLSEAGFNVRKGNAVGLKATLRGERMYSFLDRLISTALPRVRDFRGVSRSAFDEQGNYTLGIADHTIFPEIDLVKVDKAHGFEVTIVTSSKVKDQAKRLLELLGMPFAHEEDN